MLTIEATSVKSYQSREFALRAGVTVRALHHYDWLGLLEPSRRSRAERAQALVTRWRTLVEGFTGGDPEIQKGLNRMYSDVPNWPAERQATFQTAFGIRPEIQEFIRKAMAASR
jgi:hypothetical protein